MQKLPGLPLEFIADLKEKTRNFRKGLMVTTVLVDASVATCSEWISVVTDYVGPQINQISGRFLDHQVRNVWPSDYFVLTIREV